MPTGRLRVRRRSGYRPVYVTPGLTIMGDDGGLIFDLPLKDLGAGAVNTAPNYAQGSPTPTFTRASVAWTKLSTGLWAEVATGVARSCYLGADTTVGAYGGYFAEDAGTQLVTPTASIRDMTDASWVAVTCTKAKTATGIDGVANSASTLTATGASATVLQTLVAAATSRTYSAFVRRKTGTGTILLKQGTATLDITALINSTTYTRVSLNDNELNVAFGFQINTSGDEIEVDFNQFEAGAGATSPMASAGAARNADTLAYPIASNVSVSEGSFYLENASSDWTSSGRTINSFGIPFAFNVATTPVTSWISTNSYLRMSDSLSNHPIGPAGTPTGVIKWGGSWSTSGNLMTAYANGSVGTTTAYSGSMGTLTSISVGCQAGGGGNSYAMHKNLHIYNRALSAAQLQAMTA